MAAKAAEMGAPRAPGLMKLAWPVAMESILYMALFWIDSIVINRKLGTEAFAAVNVSGQLFMMVQLVLNMVAAGASIVISHQVGAGEKAEAGRTAAQSIGISILGSVALGALLMAAASPLLALLGAVGAAHTQGLVFLRVSAGFMPTLALVSIIGAILRSTGNTKGPMQVTLIVNGINLALNLLLVLGSPAFDLGGLLHVPAIGGGMGVLGSALGTSLARLVGVGLLVRMLGASELVVRLKRMFAFSAQTLWRVARQGVPSAFEGVTWQGGQFVLSIIVAPLGTAMIAARGITFQTEWFTVVPAVALDTAAAIVVGQLMGAGLRDEAVRQARRALIMGVVLLGALGVVLWFFGRPIAAIFTTDLAVLGYAVGALKVAALYKVGQSLNMVLGGVFRGAGNPQWPTILTTVGTWLITVPGAWLAVRLGYGLTGVFAVMFVDEMVRGAINLWYYTTPRWRHREV